MSTELELLGITQEDLIDRVVNRIVDNAESVQDVIDRVEYEIKGKIDEVIKTRLSDRIDAVLAEMAIRVMDETIDPVDIWGKQVGGPTTIRQMLHQKSMDFWNVTVDSNGKPTEYGREKQPRHKFLIAQISKEQFEEAVKENASEVVDAFRAAMKEESGAWVAKYINQTFKNKR